MYSTCLFCNENLGQNEVVEHFPVGRRLAFDAAKGRLWVVCRRCERWNLTPVEERWEAIEECERIFSETRLRVSTDNIGLAKLREGLELVRIGSALRPEMAAWRYGDQFGRRRRTHLLLTGGAIAAVGGMVVLGPMTGVIAGGGWGTWQIVSNLYQLYQTQRVRVRLKVPELEAPVAIRKKELEKAAIVRLDDDWGLRLVLNRKSELRGRVGLDWRRGIKVDHGPQVDVTLTGADAIRAAGKVLPAINSQGAKAKDVQSAVQIIGEQSDPGRLFQRFAGSARPRRVDRAPGHTIQTLPQEVRLALEMAAHEEQERRAMEGELAILAAAWRDAEEVAHIADDLLTPRETDARLEELKNPG